MQYVRSISGSVSTAWNSINPATLSGAIDVIVVEQEDGTLVSSPIHVRYGKISLLRPSNKRVEFKVNGVKQDFPMKLGEGGEAFFVFETNEAIPEALQTSPLISPTTSPGLHPDGTPASPLQEPDVFDLEGNMGQTRPRPYARNTAEMDAQGIGKAKSEDGALATISDEPSVAVPQRRGSESMLGASVDIHGLPKLERTATDSDIPAARAAIDQSHDNASRLLPSETPSGSPTSAAGRPSTPSSQSREDAVTRAINLSKKLWSSNIPTQVTDAGDLMLDMKGYKADASEALQAEGIARKLLSEELEGPYDIGSLIGADENGNLWIYSSEEAKAAAGRRAAKPTLGALEAGFQSAEAISDPGYHSDEERSEANDLALLANHIRHDNDSAVGMASGASSPAVAATAGDPNRNYAKTLRLTSEQLKSMNLSLGANTISFTVNRATCTAVMWYWKYDVPIVISDIDGTITKSDVLGHVLNTLGRDWTHLGVAKLYTEIAANGYNFIYLTSRSVGQADTTRAYLDGVVQDGYRLPKGPVILSPDRTIAALRREVYLRKPEIFKMACLRDIKALYNDQHRVDTHASAEAGLHSDKELFGAHGSSQPRPNCYYAGFGNRLTDAMSYRSVDIPSTRIFTINSNSEVSLDLLSLNKYKTGYTSMREIVDHYFPPVGLRLQRGGGEEFTDFNYWRDKPLDLVDFTDSEDEDDDPAMSGGRNILRGNLSRGELFSDDEGGEEDLMDSYLSEGRPSLDDTIDSAQYRSSPRGTREQINLAENEGVSEAEDELDIEEDLPRTPDSGIQRRLDQLLGTTPRHYGDGDWGGGLTRSWDSE